MKYTLCFLFFLIFFYQVHSQEQVLKKHKVYTVWIKQSGQAAAVRGILYQTMDSSILVANSFPPSGFNEYSFNNIDILKVRRDRSVMNGALWGFGLGFPAGVIIVNSIPGGLGFLTLPVSAVAGLYIGALGAGIGALAGSVKDRIPIRNSFENFEKYKSGLLDYSYADEGIAFKHRFEHRGFAGIKAGVSFAIDEFITDFPFDGYEGMNLTGFGLSFFGGYRFTGNTGITISMTNNNFSVKKSDSSLYWTLDEFLLSPVVSLAVSDKFRFEASPGLGYASATYSDGEEFLLNGGGFAYKIDASFVYNYSKRWFATAGMGYVSSKQEYKEGGNGQARAFNLEFGIAYKFGNKSL